MSLTIFDKAESNAGRFHFGLIPRGSMGWACLFKSSPPFVYDVVMSLFLGIVVRVQRGPVLVSLTGQIEVFGIFRD